MTRLPQRIRIKQGICLTFFVRNLDFRRDFHPFPFKDRTQRKTKLIPEITQRKEKQTMYPEAWDEFFFCRYIQKK